MNCALGDTRALDAQRYDYTLPQFAEELKAWDQEHLTLEARWLRAKLRAIEREATSPDRPLSTKLRAKLRAIERENISRP